MMFRRFSPLALAAALQFMPFARLFTPGAPAGACNFAVLSTWVAGALALLGAYDTVSGASVALNSPTTAQGTNGLPFSYRITTTSYYSVMRYSAAPLPPGLALSAPFIKGIPTNSGVFSVTLIVYATGKPTLVGPLTITIVDGAGPTLPAITHQPTAQAVARGTNVTFGVGATGTPPLSYQWWFDGHDINGATTNSYTIPDVLTNATGLYSVVITNFAGSVTSNPAMLTVLPAPAPTVTLRGSILANQLMLSFDTVAGQTYALEYKDILGSNSWFLLTNIMATAANSTSADSLTNAAHRFYRVRTAGN